MMATARTREDGDNILDDHDHTEDVDGNDAVVGSDNNGSDNKDDANKAHDCVKSPWWTGCRRKTTAT